MDQRKLSRRQLLKAAGVLGATAAVFDPTKVFADENEGNGRVTWDLVNVNFVNGSPTHITRGGTSKAMSTDQNHAVTAEITMTGHGTFPNRDKCSKNVTGGGTWSVTTAAAVLAPCAGHAAPPRRHRRQGHTKLRSRNASSALRQRTSGNAHGELPPTRRPHSGVHLRGNHRLDGL
ncbi:MAG: twin-arginine translocation signal domain-containing protein [Chloroflexi bacterium]|nr:MAG: twin-arginine translocation signal domain-containing protein [Chloroflexota bacterium]